MKKFALLFILFFNSIFCFSQITIDSLARPIIGTTVKTYLLDTVNFKNIYSITGPNQIWDYSNHGEDTSFNIKTTFLDAKLFPESSNFPSANLAIDSAGHDSTRSFYSSGKTGLFFKGSYLMNKNIVNNPMEVFNPAQFVVKFPLDYGDSFTNVAQDINYYSNSTSSNKTVSSFVQKVNVDGWGILKLPNNVIHHVLKATIHQNWIDSVYTFNGTTYQYSSFQIYPDSTLAVRWYSNNTDYPIVAGATIHSPKIYGAFYYKSLTRPATNIASIINSNPTSSVITVSPNPASDKIIIRTYNHWDNGSICYFLVNSEGKLILTDNGFNVNEISVNTSNFQEGIYYLTMEKGDLSITKKIIIKH